MTDGDLEACAQRWEKTLSHRAHCRALGFEFGGVSFRLGLNVGLVVDVIAAGRTHSVWIARELLDAAADLDSMVAHHVWLAVHRLHARARKSRELKEPVT